LRLISILDFVKGGQKPLFVAYRLSDWPSFADM